MWILRREQIKYRAGYQTVFPDFEHKIFRKETGTSLSGEFLLTDGFNHPALRLGRYQNERQRPGG